MSSPIYIVDAFTDQPFTGNQAAVCLLNQPADAQWMQQVAAEMQLSETAFLAPLETGRFSLRWFTPKVEVPLCGHATLASAQVLWQEQGEHSDLLCFETASGELIARRHGEAIELDFPSDPVADTDKPEGLELMFGAAVEYVGRTRGNLFVVVESRAVLESLQPDISEIAELPVMGVSVSARGDGDPYDVVSRYFAPAAGIDEDPVTGSAHCGLADYWTRRLGRQSFRARQVSARGGDIGVQVSGDRVLLTGQATVVVRGQLTA